MDILPYLPKQDAQSNPRGHGSCKFSSVLSKVQTGKFDRSAQFTYNTHQRAGRIDAEPMKDQSRLSAFLVVNFSLSAAEQAATLLNK